MSFAVDTSGCAVLLVDDDPVSLALLEENLRGRGYQLFTATDAEGATRCLNQTQINIVIADWVMPQASGLDLCRWVRAQQFDHPIHFVMLTVHSERERLIEAFEAGVDDFLSKPIDDRALLARFRAWTRFVKLQQVLAEQKRDADVLNVELTAANDRLAVANARLAELALQDELTLLPNRREAMRRLDDCWANAQRYGHPLSCLMMDVDQFKSINDRFGHAAGDAVLRHIASILREQLRSADGVFRIGGDEFLVLLPSTSASQAAAFAKRCQESLTQRPCSWTDTALHCNVSIGIAEMSKKTASGAELVRLADESLYAVKHGREVQADTKASVDAAPRRVPVL